jgi:hypothetical protein
MAFSQNVIIEGSTGTAYLIGYSDYIWHFISPNFNIITIPRVIQLVSLILSEIWSMATIMKAFERIIVQKFDFLGRCQSSEHYTVSRILLNRSVSRPLVR